MEQKIVTLEKRNAGHSEFDAELDDYVNCGWTLKNFKTNIIGDMDDYKIIYSFLLEKPLN